MTVFEMPAGGDMWALDADLYVVPTNCRGVFGAGVAKQFAQWFPNQILRYQRDCKAGDVAPGGIHVEDIGTNAHGNRAFVALMATKDDWQEPSRPEWIDAGLWALWHAAHINLICPRGLVSLPAVGSGLGGLDFEAVRGFVLTRFDSDHQVSVALFPPR